MKLSRLFLIAAGTTCLTALPALAQDAALCGGFGADAVWAGGDEASSAIDGAADPFTLEGSVPAGGAYTVLFTVGAAADVRVEAEPEAAGDTVIDLRDAAGTILLNDDDGGGFLSSRGEIALEPGTYCLSTTSYDSSDIGATIRVGLQSHAALTDAPAPTPAPAPGPVNEETANLCAGYGARAVWAGGDEASSAIDLASGPFTVAGSIPANGEYTVLFTVTNGTDVRVEAAPQREGDTVIDLRDANGTVLLSDDDGGGFLSSRGETYLNPGTYCLSASSYDSSNLQADIRVGLTTHEALTAGSGNGGGAGGGVCLPDTEAVAIFDGAPVDSELEAGLRQTAAINDTPFYRFTLSEPQPISVTAENPSADPVLSIYDDTGYLLAENDDFDGLNSRIDFTEPLEAGTYCIGLEALSDGFSPVTVTLSAYDEEAFMASLYNNAEAAPPLDGSYPVTDLGAIEGRIRRDVRDTDDLQWFSFEVTEPGLILIEGIETGNNDPMLTLFDDLGRRLDQNDDYGATYSAQIAARVNRGVYLLAVGRPGGLYGQASVTRLAIERFVPAQ
ncbi:PPC domain-containing protein [Pontivivens ytuae]|uniref:PPC domain-containing protein n=1 Tax=Pontivivens ytuae TaxID=2789856 RepID=A0A7S9QDM2_9RHOB|nr:PPC domain-containing protein [Pontivivens ytuae]QPH55428.1 PPC domain-containing protein [Pontivivens ytuae]